MERVRILPRASAIYLLAQIALLFTGCNRDADALNKFSHSYSSFLDRESDANAASLVPLIRSEDNPNNSFWQHLKAALDSHSSNAERAQSASKCITAYHDELSPYLEHFSDEIERVDSGASELIEIANTVRDSGYRSEALDVAKSSHEIHKNLARIYQLLVRRFITQREIMEKLVATEGDLTAALTSARQKSQTILKFSEDLEERRTALTSSVQDFNDAFSALKGHAGLTQYAAK